MSQPHLPDSSDARPSGARPSRPWDPPVAFVRALRRWPVASQVRARRNAMMALNALARRRAEQAEADAYLAALGRTPRRRSAGGS